jgi:D-arabinose 1-dehydrogenase-like Zn-dependent alcohol dehydrogenase
VVVAGATAGPNPPADLPRIFWRQIRVLGSTMGSLPEFLSMIRFVETTGIKPVIDRTYALDDVRAALERMAAGEQTGKLAIEIAR